MSIAAWLAKSPSPLCFVSSEKVSESLWEAIMIGRARWCQQVESKTDIESERSKLIKLIDRPDVGPLFNAIFAASPFLTDQALKELEFVATCLDFNTDADLLFQTVLDALIRDASSDAERRKVMIALRVARRRVALLTALCDLSGCWHLAKVTQTLTRFADLSLDIAIGHVMARAMAAGHLTRATGRKDENIPGNDMLGYVVLGMGKLGARELNYSSDIDLILLFDPGIYDFPGKFDAQSLFSRLTRDLVGLLQERTVEGHVHRVDLRLRPDPASTPPALSLGAAIAYYESVGQNWERAAMIKARPAGGDRALGRRFLKEIQPFIWRRHLDFAAIRDIHNIKRQIDHHRGNTEIVIPGHNIKTGHGGIREIEFFVQSQQLVWGGRDSTLRVSGTVAGLSLLAKAGHIPQETAHHLTHAYTLLRMVEHRLQMIADQQTQTLPVDPSALECLALFCGFRDQVHFTTALIGALQRVRDYYDWLFEPESDAIEQKHAIMGNLVFIGSENDPETLRTLAGMGFGQPVLMAETIRGWHHGRYRAIRTERARQLLTDMMPQLLTVLAKTVQPDMAFAQFDLFLSRLPSGIQLFSLFESNPALLDLLAEVMGTAPALAEYLARQPILFDALLEPDFFNPIPDLPTLIVELQEQLSQGRDLQDYFDQARCWSADRRFQIGVQLLRGSMDGIESGKAFADIAEAVLRALTPRIITAFADGEQHGRVPGGQFAIIGLGRLGAGEMNPGSDLDLVFVYDVDGVANSKLSEIMSDGARPLAASVWFSRLVQRVVSALTVATGEGRLYEVDLRLRPHGNQGPVAVSRHSYLHYIAKEAWIWEYQALTRARLVYSANLCATQKQQDREAARAENLVSDITKGWDLILRRPCSAAPIARAVLQMRQRIAEQKPARGFWDIRYASGGLTDLDFLVQALWLLHGHTCPMLQRGGNHAALAALMTSGLLTASETANLQQAGGLWLHLICLLRLTLGSDSAEDPLEPRIVAVLCRAVGLEGLVVLRAAVTQARQIVLAAIESHLRQYVCESETESLK